MNSGPTTDKQLIMAIPTSKRVQLPMLAESFQVPFHLNIIIVLLFKNPMNKAENNNFQLLTGNQQTTLSLKPKSKFKKANFKV